MKLLVDHDLAALNAFLSCVNVGDYVVSGQAESYSCTSRHRDVMSRPARMNARARGNIHFGLVSFRNDDDDDDDADGATIYRYFTDDILLLSFCVRRIEKQVN